MTNTQQNIFSVLAFCILCGVIYLTLALISPPVLMIAEASLPGGACTAFCLDNGNGCVFGANQDNTLEMGLLFINKRNILKTNWDPSASGEYARWISRYGSVTINFTGYQMAWAGMNEAGLMLSTMSLAETQPPRPDERPPFNGPFWMQYQLDTSSSVEQVIASDAETRLVTSAVDHYLVCDHTGTCAVIEFMDGQLVYHTGENLSVKVLTNNTYDDSVSAWQKSLLTGDQPEGNSLWRFATAANRVKAFEPSKPDAVAYAFDTLKAVSREDTVWSFVFDPANLRVHFRTNDNPNIRYVDFSSLDFSCKTPVKLLDVHTDLSGDVSDDFVAYTHQASFTHTRNFFSQYQGVSVPPLLADTLLWGLESFPCQDGDISTQADLVLYHPLIPPTVGWAGLMILHRVGPFWILLVVLSLAFVIWRMATGYPSSTSKRLVWVLVTIILGPFGLLAYLLSQRKKHRIAKAP